MTRIEDTSITLVTETPSSSSSSMTNPNTPLDASSDASSTENPTDSSTPSTLETSTRTELDLIITAGTSSTTSDSAPTGTDFTGMQAGQGEAQTTPDAAGAASTSPANSGASTLSSTFAVLAASFFAALTILI